MLPDAYPPRQRRRFSPEFKRQLVEQCQPGISVAGIAIANDINPNQLQRWIRQSRAVGHAAPVSARSVVKLVPVSVGQPVASAADSMIEITLSGKSRTASLRWPVSAASVLAPLLAEWVK